MQVVTVTRKTYPNGDRVDKTDTYITNGYRKPGKNRPTYEFNTPSGKQIFQLSDIVEITIENDGMGDPTEQIIKQYPNLNWLEWYTYTDEETLIKELLETIE